jgi:uncharacterized protein (DUF488 family)
MPPTIYTIGHSTRSLEAFVGLLRAHGVSQLADVRTIPHSRRHPHFSRERLAPALAALGISYRHFPALGGLRRPRAGSTNIGWRNQSFRGYADHMQTAEFAAGLTDLLSWSELARTAVMCAEALWWRCHRALLSDALVVRGQTVLHINASDRSDLHQLCDFARTDGEIITYVEDTSVPRRMRGNHTTRNAV